MVSEAPPSWSRETPWRQGHVLPVSVSKRLCLQHAEFPDDTCVIVIGHDCDLANDNLDDEPNVEVVVGRVVSPENGSFMWSKSPRTLHVSFQRDGTEVFAELVATNKQLIRKNDLAAELPDRDWQLSPLNLSVLRAWLGVRYNRGAFPDNFVTRMKKKPGVEERMVKVLKTHTEITAVYLDLDNGENLDRPPEEVYALSIFLAYTPNPEPDEAADAAETVATAIEKLFYEKCHDKKSGEWQHLKLVKCVPLSEDDLTVSQQRLLREWKLEHVSLKAEAEPVT
jgi:hypothetical protein